MTPADVRSRGRPRMAGDCRAHREALLGLLEGPAGTAVPAAARLHLDDCRHCRERLARLLLTGYAVRRAFADARRVPAPGDAWPRLKARLQRRSPNLGRAASPIAGLALSAALAASLLLPLGVINTWVPQGRTPGAAIHEAGVDPAVILAAGRLDAEAEARHLRETVRARKEAMSSDAGDRARAALIRHETTFMPDRRSSRPHPLAASVE